MPEKKANILLAEDDTGFGELLKSYLEMNDFAVCWCKTGVEAFRAFRRQDFDICLLDVMMPDMNGFELAAEIKQLQAEKPLLFISAKSMREDILAGYQCGADDYITKPFDAELLIYKINAVLKRSGTNQPKENKRTISLGTYLFTPEIRLLKGPKKEQRLSPKENELLQMLCLYRDSVLPREIALKNIWGSDDYFSGRSMDVYITKIRKYLKDDPSLELISIHGKGYRLSTSGFILS